LVSRVEALASIVVVLLLTAGIASADPPDQVQYLPRDGAAIVTWMAPTGNVTGYNVYQQIVTDPKSQPAAATKVNTDPIKETSFMVPNLMNGTAYHFSVSAIVDGKESEQVGPFPAQTDQGTYVAVIPQKPVKLGGAGEFYGSNIGTNYPGSHEVDAQGTIMMKASGWDIQSDADGCYFLAMPMAGDITVTVRCVSGPTATSDDNGWNLGGPMIRESLDARARLAMTQVARTGNLQFKRRTGFAESPPDTQTTDIDPTKRPVWLRIVRKVNDFTGFVSEDGTNWIQVGDTETIDNFAKEPYVGLTLSAHQDGEYTTAVFDNFKITSP
jgi:Fibronectin type III domain